MGALLNRRRYMGGGGESPVPNIPLTFEALADNVSFTFKIPSGLSTTELEYMSYSVDGGTPYTEYNVNSSEVVVTTPAVNKGQKVSWNGHGKRLATSASVRCQFTSTGAYSVAGNIVSLVRDDLDDMGVINQQYFACQLFYNQSNLTDISKMLFPTDLSGSNYAFYQSFMGCSNLSKGVSILPALILANGCYYSMFENCYNLVNGAELPSSQMFNYCYQRMYYANRKLASASKVLPATAPANSCYAQMYNSCLLLEKSPVISIEHLTVNFATGMFAGCSKMKDITAMFLDTPTSSSTNAWVQGVASNGVFHKNPDATWDNVFNTSAIPTGWTVVNA